MSENKVIPLAPVPASPRLEERSDDELMALAKAGVQQAFATLADRYMLKLIHFAAKLTGQRDAAEEIAQDTWLQIWSHRNRYVATGRFPVLLYTTARNRCRNHRRDRHRACHHLDDDAVDVDQLKANEPDHLDRLLAEERRSRVQDAIVALPEKLRDAVLLRFSEGLAYEDIAKIVNASETTVRSRVFHGIKKLRARMEKGSQS